MKNVIVQPCTMIVLSFSLLWCCSHDTRVWAAELRPPRNLSQPAPPLSAPQSPSPSKELRSYERFPAKNTVPAPPLTTYPEQRRDKYSNPYDRSVPFQGDIHKGYAPARREPFAR